MKKINLLLFTFCFAAVTNAQVSVSGGTGLAPTYTTLTNAGGLFAAINATAQTGNTIIVTITGNVATEAGTNSLNTGTWSSITISPSGARTISGSVANLPLIGFSGADNVTINGLNTGGNTLIISNTSTSATAETSTIRFISGATNNVIANCTVLGSATMPLITNGGTIYFSTDGVTANGNDNNTISNCNIGPAGANLPSKAIYGIGTTATAANRNNGILINNNNIYDFFNATTGTSGIHILSGNDGWTISNNRIYQTAARVFTTSFQRYSGIVMNTTTLPGSFTITGNTIGFANAAGTGTTTVSQFSSEFRGIDAAQVSTTTATSIQGNIISGINYSSGRNSNVFTNSCFIGIMLGTTGGYFNCGGTTGNTIGSLDGSSTIAVNASSTFINTAPMMCIYDITANGNTISNNNMGSITINPIGGTGTEVGFRGIFVNTTITGVTATINNNMIGGSAAGSITDNLVGVSSGGYSMYCIQVFNANVTATGNTIRNITGFSSVGFALFGMYMGGSTGNNIVSQNTVYSLTNTPVPISGVIIAGLGLHFSPATNIIDRNFVHSLYINSTNTGCSIYGIIALNGTGNVATYSNNMVRLGIKADGTSIPNAYQIYGLSEATNNNINNFYHNSVYIGGTGVAASTSKTYAFYSGVTTNSRNFENNIFVNARSNTSITGTAQHFAIKVGGTTQYPTGLTSNYNVLYATGTDGAIGEFNSTAYPTLPNWRTATGEDMISIDADPQFILPTGTSTTVDLHLQASIYTVCEGNGLTGLPVTLDYDGQTRSSLTPVDIGADAGDFFNPILTDLIGPEMSYTPIPNGSCLSSGPTLSAVITDISGVNTTVGTKPRLYYKRSTDGNTYTNNTSGGVGWKYVEASNVSSPFSFTIDYTLLSGGTGVTAGNVVQYFLTSQDLVTTPNVSINSGIYAPAFMPASVTLTATAFPVHDPVRTYTVTAAGLSGSVTIGVAGTYTSLTGAGGLFAAINAAGIDANVTATIIDASVTETGAIALNQMVYGCTTSTLTIKPAVAGTVLTGSLANDALIKIKSSNVVLDGSSNATNSQDLTISNTSPVASAVLLIGSTGTVALFNVTVKNAVIVNGSSTDNAARAVVVSDGTTIAGPGYFTTVTLQNNDIRKSYAGIYANASVSTGNGGINITSNKLNNAANPIGNMGIYVQGADGVTVSGNDVGNFETATAENDMGIRLSTGTQNATVENNVIHDIKYTGVLGYAGKGIVISTGLTAAGITVKNNMIYGISGDANSYTSNGALYCPVGIYAFGTGQGGVNIYYNSIYLTGAALNFAADVYSIGIALDNNTAATIKDNIVYNQLGLLGGIGVGAVGVAAQTSAAQFTALDYNDYYSNVVLGTNLIGKIGATDYATLATWRTATGQEANSLNIIPVFISTTDLHLDPANNCGIDGYGTSIAGITTDYDIQTRDITTPDMGADEFISTYSVTLAGVAGSAICESKTVSVSGTIYTTNACNLIARVLPSGADPVTGIINTCVTLDASQLYFNGEPYVQRHYDLEPASSNQTTTSATITLYFTNEEFALYNSTNPVWPALPTAAGGGNFDPNIANVKVTQFHGTPTGGLPTSTPGNYTGLRVLLAPVSVVLNAGIWEVTISIAGFSGFYVHSNNYNAPLPITINYFTGTRSNGTHLLNWKITCVSVPSATIEMERSTDGRNYSSIYSVFATALRCQQPFNYTDNQPAKGINYYRLKMTDADGKVTYSTTVTLINAVKGIDVMNIAPNPVVNSTFNLQISSADKTQIELVITDMQGRVLQKQSVNVIAGFNTIPMNVKKLAAGTYQLFGNTADGRTRVLRFVIQ